MISIDAKKILIWFVAPFMIIVMFVNITQLAPVLASWTVISVLDREGAIGLWLLFIVLYSFSIALVGGLCSYRIATVIRNNNSA